MWVHTYKYMYQGQRTTWGVLFQEPSTLFSETEPLTRILLASNFPRMLLNLLRRMLLSTFPALGLHWWTTTFEGCSCLCVPGPGVTLVGHNLQRMLLTTFPALGLHWC